MKKTLKEELEESFQRWDNELIVGAAIHIIQMEWI